MKKLIISLLAFIAISTANAAPTGSVQWGYDPTQTFPIFFKYGSTWYPMLLPGAAANNMGSIMITQSPYNAKCDGISDDRAAINSAIIAAGTNGVVEFPKGKTCAISNVVRIPLNQERMTIEGNGAIIKLLNNTEGFHVLGSENRINNLNIDGNSQTGKTMGVYGHRNRLYNMTLHHSKSHGVFFDGQATQCYDNTIINSEIYTNYDIGISQNKCPENKIIGNMVHDNGLEGITIDLLSERGSVMGNVLTNNAIRGGVGGIGMDQVGYVTISGNVIQRTQSNLPGIRMQNNVGESVFNTITGNTLIDNTGGGIDLKTGTAGGSFNNTVTGNTITNDGPFSINIDLGSNENTIISNQIETGGIITNNGAQNVLGNIIGPVIIGNISPKWFNNGTNAFSYTHLRGDGTWSSFAERAAGTQGWMIGAVTTGISNQSGMYQETDNSITYSARDGSGNINVNLRSDSNNSYVYSSNFGIGTRTPTAPLNVVKSDSTGWGILTQTNGLSNDSGFYQTTDKSFLIVARNSSGTPNVNFSASASESSWINAGSVGIGTNAPADKFHVNGTMRYTSRPAAAAVTTIGVDGNGVIREATSSRRFKEDIKPYKRGLDAVIALNPVSFKYKGDNHINAGFIAEDFDHLGYEEFVIKDKEGKPYSITYANMVALLTNAIKELKSDLDATKLRLKSLENK